MSDLTTEKAKLETQAAAEVTTLRGKVAAWAAAHPWYLLAAGVLLGVLLGHKL